MDTPKDPHANKILRALPRRREAAQIAPVSIPDTPASQFQEQQAIAWSVIRWLQGVLVEGGEEQKWKAARMLREYLSMTSDWLGLARDLIKESDEFQESQEIRQAVLDVLATETPATRSRFLERLEEIQGRRAVGGGSSPGARRRKGRPRGG